MKKGRIIYAGTLDEDRLSKELKCKASSRLWTAILLTGNFGKDQENLQVVARSRSHYFFSRIRAISSPPGIR